MPDPARRLSSGHEDRLRTGPPVDRHLGEGVLALWADVTNAGGAVGFVPPVTPEDVRPQWLRHLTAMGQGHMRLLVGYDEDGSVAATAFIALNTHPLMAHWVWLYTVMVHPRHQGGGHGRALLAACEDAVRGMDGIEAVRLACRGGMGLERFYASCGYKEVGRVPDAIRVADGDYRDDVIMLLPLK
ncbi:GNAT family N-acetyltransferase [Streptomyces sudanensis]|uniref:GNAT family N-acetyltransferase n=1 Tax=Streptomyces sudanensis TaxID=436397 RepID=UPI0020CE498F|nr:GNAT family N-acetyltransferase [Streptomyces sudanensis]MCP9957832.1 GNAT family N-acetyltransferase [Streptomyces sudanensis]MCQ0001628.1 GNAT family N-acetyltransferase [Streptomyces sudanensis]